MSDKQPVKSQNHTPLKTQTPPREVSQKKGLIIEAEIMDHFAEQTNLLALKNIVETAQANTADTNIANMAREVKNIADHASSAAEHLAELSKCEKPEDNMLPCLDLITALEKMRLHVDELVNVVPASSDTTS